MTLDRYLASNRPGFPGELVIGAPTASISGSGTIQLARSEHSLVRSPSSEDSAERQGPPGTKRSRSGLCTADNMGQLLIGMTPRAPGSTSAGGLAPLNSSQSPNEISAIPDTDIMAKLNCSNRGIRNTVTTGIR